MSLVSGDGVGEPECGSAPGASTDAVRAVLYVYIAARIVGRRTVA